jgi:hypothetical protein
MPDPTPDLDALRALAEAIEDGGWYNAAFLGAFIDDDDEQMFGPQDAAYIAAADPATILRLIAMARGSALNVERLAEALFKIHMPMPWRWWDGADVRGTSAEFAAAIAREYIRLRT